jgi:oligopeptide/dipeptide ABC transporter ATP-binding protein
MPLTPDWRNDMLLEVKNLSVHFPTETGIVRAADGVDFEVEEKEILGLAGESACGKSVTALSILDLVPPPGKVTSGEIFYKGRDLLKCSEEVMRSIRGKEISMVFQEPATSLNPVFTVGDQIMESLILHRGLSSHQARTQAIQLLGLVNIPAPEVRIDDYPHNLSGGMKQRVMIAMALACNPTLLIADELTTALDVTTQAQILELLKELQEKLKMSIILITHNLGIISQVTDRVAIMYAGRIVEYGRTKTILNEPLHPYTKGLLESVPNLETTPHRLSAIRGTVPRPSEWPTGCRFHPRCGVKLAICSREEPGMKEVLPGHKVRCHLAKG